MNVESQYRIYSIFIHTRGYHSWRVQKLYDDVWQDVYFCGSEENAKRCLVRCLERQEKWLTMSEEERRQAILRATK